MKKRIAGILISILLLSTLSGCGKDKDFSYVDEPATTNDATNASVLHRNYEVTDGLLTFTVDADVDTSLSARFNRWRDGQTDDQEAGAADVW